jgi:hypothetical protein
MFLKSNFKTFLVKKKTFLGNVKIHFWGLKN